MPVSKTGGRAAAKSKDEHAFDAAFSLINAIEDKGVDVMGIYRVNGSHTTQIKLKEALIKASNEQQRKELIASNSNIHELTTTLKQLLRELDPPLLTSKYYPMFIDAAKEPKEQRNAKIASLLQNLPRARLKLAASLIYHLRRVSKHQATNKMDDNNLALMFGPSFLRSPNGALDEIRDAGHRSAVLMEMLKAKKNSPLGELLADARGRKAVSPKKSAGPETPTEQSAGSSESPKSPHLARQRSYAKKGSPLKKLAMDTVLHTMAVSTTDAFKLFDKDNNGTIDQEGMSTILRAQGHVLSNSELRQLFKALDINGDGLIDEQEFQMASSHQILRSQDGENGGSLKERADMAMSLFQQFDIGNQGHLTKAELEYVCRTYGEGDMLSHSEVAELMGELGITDSGPNTKIEYEDITRSLAPALVGAKKHFA
eukprot:m.50866 g.50866  ORF g.50866 m.50866 type:complete len:428 (+) comp10690_c0_seq1:294-1577(+)